MAVNVLWQASSGWLRGRTLHLNRPIVVRIAADAVILSSAWLVGLVARYVWMLLHTSGPLATVRETFVQSLEAYARIAAPLTLGSLGIFYVSGFYTRGRSYRGRYKALVVTQAVTILYLVIAALDFLVPGLLPVPRHVLPLAWGLTLATLLGARVGSMAWRVLGRWEEEVFPAQLERSSPRIQRILVIGGAGYIGSALLRKLLEKDYRVRLLDLFLYGTDPIADLLNHPNLEIVRADFRQVDNVVAAVAGVDAVIHLGAIVGDPACALDEQLTIEVNLMATRMIAQVAKGAGVRRLLFASTCSVYGASEQLLDECSCLNPVSLYARSKIASERVLMQMADAKFAPVILRFGTIYGLSGRTRFDLVVNLLSAKALVEGRITVFGGDQWRPFIHVDDAALAVLMALEAPAAQVENQVFNVASSEQNYTLVQVGEIIQRLVPGTELVDMGCDSDRRNYRVNAAKIRRVLGFTPQWTLEQGVEQVIGAIRAGKVRDYRDARYSNVKFLGDEGLRLLATQKNWAWELINETASRTPQPVEQAA